MTAYIDENDNSDRNLEEDLICAVKFALGNVPMSDPKLEEVRVATAADTTMGKLKQVIHSGWPNKRREVPADIKEYWNYRDELSEVNDIK